MGLSREGGLFVPETVPTLTSEEIASLCALDYRERAVRIMKLFLEDYSEEELRDFANAAYARAYLRLQGYGASDAAPPPYGGS